ncbi:hypothetical protein Poli38472_005917 [Pythium oligandrum]|uniref:TRP C-terminal domain-containing protein n=1 Tax=Pythium oligandrum TaxID=41045 RepID=A0A8K1CSK0_PYTOL|nr:hypothetical protein Poli38472_005917 [Pythium oligandrum]|eukprot:TMW68449.1 hypothetical protein Poli38472_005917 [Pythium oligandrum]
MAGCGQCCARSCACVTRVVLAALLLALIPAGYLTYEFYLKDWGADRLDEYAKAVADAASNASLPSLGNTTLACAKCPGVNMAFPINTKTHPTYGSFQVTMMNDAGWMTSAVTTAGVAVGAGGSVLLSLLSAVHGASTTANGCGIFEMAFIVGQAQFMTLLGALQTNGVPIFFLEFCRKLAWTNLQIFPQEASYDPTSSNGEGKRRLLGWDTDAAAGANGVERYSLLVGVEPNHLFYYTCVALAVVLVAVLLVYLVVRLVLSKCKREAAVALDHRVIWFYIQLLLLGQYIISMTACFQIYFTATRTKSMGDLGLAIVILAIACLGVLIFGIIKIARHQEELRTHGSDEHDADKGFHQRYSAFYQDYTVENVYFFVVKMVLDFASGAVVATVQDVMVQIGVLVGLNVLFLLALIIRQPYLIPLFYYVGVLAGYLRVVLLLLTLIQAYPDIFPQDVRDFVAVLIICINGVLILCVLIRQLYVLCVAVYKWCTRSKTQSDVDQLELAVPLNEPESRKSNAASTSDKGSYRSSKAKKPSSLNGGNRSSMRHTQDALFDEQPSPLHRTTSPTSAPTYFEIGNGRYSLPTATSAPVAVPVATPEPARASVPAKRPHRSLYKQRRRKNKFEAVKDDDLPEWARI